MLQLRRAARRTCILGFAALLGLSGCRSANHHPSAQPSEAVTSMPPSAAQTVPTTRFAAVDHGAAVTGTPCLVPLPAAWQQALHDGQLWNGVADQLPSGVPVQVGSQSGVLHQQAGPTGVQVSVLGRNRQPLAQLGSIPARPDQQGGISYASSDAGRIAFVYNLATGEDQQDTWKLYLWSRGRLQVVAGNPVTATGLAVRGGWVHPLLHGQFLYWIEAVPGSSTTTPGSRLEQYDLTTGRIRTLYSGLTQSYVAYQDEVLFTAATGAHNGDGTPKFELRAVSAATGRPAAPPAGLAAAADLPDFIVGDGDLLVWDTTAGGLKAWRPSWQKSLSLFPDLSQVRPAAWAEMGQPAMPRLWGNYLIWSDKQTYVLDLRTNSFVQLTANHGTEDLAGSQLGLWEYTTDSRPSAPGQLIGTAYLLDLAQLPQLPGCH